MIFKCRITFADTDRITLGDTEDTNVDILYFPDRIKIISIEELGLGNFSSGIIKHL